LRFLADYAAESEADFAGISYFGAANPAYYGLEIESLFDGKTGQPLGFNRANPANGRYAISANHVTGQVLVEPDTFDWFRRHEPVDNVGYSIFVYDVPTVVAGEWLAFCNNPAPLLNETQAAQLVGQTGLRPVYFDCHSSWLFPANGRAGWYIVPQQTSWPLAKIFSDNLRLVYSHDATEMEPSYAVWYWDGQADLEAWTAVSPTPLAVNSAANLMGYTANQADWWTIWQVQATPTAPLTIAAHLYADAPTPVVADGLGFTSEQWQPGDWLVQMHHFDGFGNGRYLETGLYNYLTGERLADFVQLPPK
jgi:hypothetical protein